ncbi:heterokaryon incompatibility protein-domain-containing protein [Fennellomyces sp. T-0311]|nr:heterokaryon incompatibility protein-domain-containing protein [Fennellomyces sp. T-0311]
MYVTYVSDQISIISKSRPSNLQSGSEFRPTWLVRVDDMALVQGSEAKKEGYCALSYSWNYSGDIEIDDRGKSTFIDRSKHKIIFNRRKNGEKHQEEHLVRFEDVIQQICKDFQIKYIWYDKMCIDQSDKVAKQNEIKQMHKIYREANYTVALIRELHVPESIKRIDWTSYVKHRFTRIIKRKKRFAEREAYEQCIRDIIESEWSKRLWTLEEAVMSQRMVLVGSNAHMWLNFERVLSGSLFFASPQTPSGAWMNYGVFGRRPTANAILQQAHTRTTTKAHDRVFALANIFADRFQVDINYSLPIKSVMYQFYARLAAVDLTILCFGKPGESYRSTIRGLYDLPSWTGVNGAHIQDPVVPTIPPQDFNSYSVDGNMLMHIHSCRYTKIAPTEWSEYFPEELPESGFTGGLQLTHYLDGFSYKLSKRGLVVVKTSLDQGQSEPDAATLSLTEACDECILLDIPFIWNASAVLFPVIRRNEDTYKVIGVLLLRTYILNRNTGLEAIHLDELFDTDEGTFILS